MDHQKYHKGNQNPLNWVKNTIYWNLWDIAKKYNTTEEEIAEVNEIKIDEPIKPGKCLILQKKVSSTD